MPIFIHEREVRKGNYLIIYFFVIAQLAGATGVLPD